MFYVLYPIGITSEAVLVWKASEAAGEPWKFVGWGVLGLYVPGLSPTESSLCRACGLTDGFEQVPMCSTRI